MWGLKTVGKSCLRLRTVDNFWPLDFYVNQTYDLLGIDG